MVDGKEGKGTDSGDGQNSLLDAGEEGGTGPSQSVNSETTERNSEKGSGKAMGFIYFLETEDREFVKIGFSKRVHVRMSQLGTLRPTSFSFRVPGAIPAPAEVERWLHTLFAEDCDNGEWFKSTPRLRSLIEVLDLIPPVERRSRSSRSRRKVKRRRRSLVVHSQENKPEPEPVSEVQPIPEPESVPVPEVEDQSSNTEFTGKPVKCLRCGNEWTPRVPGRPKQCPSCHQAKWDVAAWTGRPPGRPRKGSKAA